MCRRPPLWLVALAALACPHQEGSTPPAKPGASGSRGDPVTTTFNDAWPLFEFTELADDLGAPMPEPDADATWTLAPGLYHHDAQSFCITAGTWAPNRDWSGGDGYGYAPLLGPQADILSSLLQRYDLDPDVTQEQAQTLIWAVIARVTPSRMSVDDQATAARLLTGDQLARLETAKLPSAATQLLLDQLPEPIQAVRRAEATLRARIESAEYTYEELERVAVLGGAPPEDAERVEVAPGSWTLHPDGYFLHARVLAYYETQVSIYVPGESSITRDTLGRITAIERGSWAARFAYDDTIPPYEVPGDPTVRGYAYSRVTLSDGSDQIVLTDVGWAFCTVREEMGALEPVDKEGGEDRERLTKVDDAGTAHDRFTKRFADAKERYDRVKAVKERWEKFKDQVDRGNRIVGAQPRKSVQELWDTEFQEEGVRAAMSLDPDAKAEWIAKNAENTLETALDAVCKLETGGAPCRGNKTIRPRDGAWTPARQGVQRHPYGTKRRSPAGR